MSAPAERDSVKVSAYIAAALGGVLALLATPMFGMRAGFSVAVGAAIAVSNLLVLRAIIRALVQATPEDAENPAPEGDHKGAGKRGGAAWGIFAMLKIFLLFGGVWGLLALGLVDPIPLVVGYGVLPLGMTGSTLLSSLRPRR